MGQPHVVVMGVSGSGKSTVAGLLARRLGWPFAEADDFHPQVNIDKMSAGTALTDEDRWPWLATIRDWISEQEAQGRPAVVACSALRRAYRDVLRTAPGRAVFVHLAGDPNVLSKRLDQRTDHFMGARLLRSQYDILEPLGDDEAGVTVSAETPPEAIVDTVVRQFGLAAP